MNEPKGALPEQTGSDDDTPRGTPVGGGPEDKEMGSADNSGLATAEEARRVARLKEARPGGPPPAQ